VLLKQPDKQKSASLVRLRILPQPSGIEDQIKRCNVDSSQSSYIATKFHNEGIMFFMVLVWVAY